MFEYNCIVTIDKKVAGDEIPVTRFTMMMERKMDVYNKVVDWVTDKFRLGRIRKYCV